MKSDFKQALSEKKFKHNVLRSFIYLFLLVILLTNLDCLKIYEYNNSLNFITFDRDVANQFIEAMMDEPASAQWLQYIQTFKKVFNH